MGQGAPPAVDATGSVDFGSIDEFRIASPHYVLVGDFGGISLECLTVPRLGWGPEG